MLYQRGVRETNLVRGEEEDDVRACLAGEEEAVRGEEEAVRGRKQFAEEAVRRKVSSGKGGGGAFYNFLLKGKIVHS
ncbi:hypothetical protein HKD37_02G003704 [Glycine soja]